MSTEFAAPSVLNPTAGEAFWRAACRTEPSCRAEFTCDDHGPAYRVGHTAPVRRRGEFDELEGAVKDDFQRVRGRSRLRRQDAREATRAAWRRVTQREEHPH